MKHLNYLPLVVTSTALGAVLAAPASAQLESGQSASGLVLEEVIVTARRREEFV